MVFNKFALGVLSLMVVTGCTASQVTSTPESKEPVKKQTLVVEHVEKQQSPNYYLSLSLEASTALRYLPCETVTHSDVDDTGMYDFVCGAGDNGRVTYTLNANEDGLVDQISLVWKEYQQGHMYEKAGNTLKHKPFLSYVQSRFSEGLAGVDLNSAVGKQNELAMSTENFNIKYTNNVVDNGAEMYKLHNVKIFVR